MTTVYIKFRSKDDVYAINPSYDLRPPGDDFVPPRICSRCGDTLYIPVELPEGATINQPGSDIVRPLPRELPDLTIRGDSGLPTLAISKSIPAWEEQRLRDFSGMAYVDSKGFEMLIVGISRRPIEHICQTHSSDCK